MKRGRNRRNVESESLQFVGQFLHELVVPQRTVGREIRFDTVVSGVREESCVFQQPLLGEPHLIECKPHHS